MKSRVFNALLMGMLVLGMPCVVVADSYTWEDSMTAGDVSNRYIERWGRLSYTHDLNDNGVEHFVVGEDTITSYSLTLKLSDDTNDSRWELCELAWVDQPGVLGDGLYTFNYDSAKYGWSFAGLAQLNETGTLTVRIHSLMGDFNFDSSTLAAYGENKSTAPVPEPATMLLMGAGLAGLGIMRRFQKPGK